MQRALLKDKFVVKKDNLKHESNSALGDRLASACLLTSAVA